MATDHGFGQLRYVARLATLNVMRKIRGELGRKLFQKEPLRLLWLAVHSGVFLLATILGLQLARIEASLFWMLPVSVLVGLSFAGLAFVAHEALHGALVKNVRLARWIGFFGFLPFCVSPRLWVAWHNRVHHGNTNVAGLDPDAYPTLSEYQSSRSARYSVLVGAPRSRKWRGILTFVIGFSVQSLQVLLFARSRGHLSTRDHRLALLETLVSFSLWVAFGVLVGPTLFALLFVIPLMIGNAVVMAHIVTNHSLNPLSNENDALATSLTVTVPKWFNFYTLGFGYHVEHHLFPGMSHKRGPEVSRLLERWAPQSYQQMPLVRALALLVRTPRVYLDASTLYEPHTGETWRTLEARTTKPPSRDDEQAVLTVSDRARADSCPPEVPVRAVLTSAPPPRPDSVPPSAV